MSKIIFSICAFFVFVVAVFICARSLGTAFPSASVPETDDENYRRGKTFAMERKDAEAMEAFYKVVNARDEAPESHLELGILALRREMPLDAIYHLRQYSRQSIDDKQKALVAEQLSAAKKMFLSEVPGTPFPTEGVEWEKKYLEQKKENDRLKNEIRLLSARIKSLEERTPLASPPQPGSAVTEVAAAPTAPERTTANNAPRRAAIPATHTVVKGDTLTRISQKYYGTQNRWREIFNYNRDILPAPGALKIGTQLKLPPQ